MESATGSSPFAFWMTTVHASGGPSVFQQSAWPVGVVCPQMSNPPGSGKNDRRGWSAGTIHAFFPRSMCSSQPSLSGNRVSTRMNSSIVPSPWRATNAL
jgi:hypothetical protein